MARLKTDWILFLTILAMVGFGLVMLYSASSAVAELRYHVPPYYFVVRQIVWAVVSFLVLMYFKRRDYRPLNTPAWAFSGLGIVLGMLVLVYFADPRAHRWFQITGLGSFQPSEFAKPALILFLAYFVSTALAGDQRPPHAAAGVRRGGDAGVHGGGRRSGNGAGAGDHRGHRVLGRRSRAALHASRRADRRRAGASSRSFRAAIGGPRHFLCRSGLFEDRERSTRTAGSAPTCSGPPPCATPAISRANRRSRSAPAASWASA